MEYLSIQEKIEIILIYGVAERNVNNALALDAQRFPDNPRSLPFFYRVVRQFIIEGIATTDVLAAVAYNPHTSTRISRNSGIALSNNDFHLKVDYII